MSVDRDQILKEALEICMDRRFRDIPDERDIRRIHTFSHKFQEQMRFLIKEENKKKKSKRTFAVRAAGWFVVLAVGAGMIKAVDMQLEKNAKKDICVEETNDELMYDEKASGKTWKWEIVEEDGDTVKLFLGNVWTDEFYYSDILEAQCWDETKGVWKTTWKKEGSVERRRLLSGERIEERILLDDYDITESGQWRMMRMINESEVWIYGEME